MTQEIPETVTVEFTIAVRNEQFKAATVVPAGQTNLTKIMPVLQILDNRFIESVTDDLAATGRSVSCKAGCGACCRQMVPISIFEAEALADWVRTLPEAKQQVLARRFHDALTKLAAAGIIDRMVNVDWLAETESARQLAVDYLFARVPCPFLENESCSIHPIRPLICREYLVTSPPEHCSDPTTDHVDPVRLPLQFSRILKVIGAELEHDSHGWIPLVFLFGWMKSGAKPGEAVTGTGPEVLYEFLKRMDQARGRWLDEDPPTA
jgi:Fe-S-cluster containining protein